MKKFFILSSILISLPAVATCSIEEGQTSCSIAQFQQKELRPTYSQDTLLKEFSSTPEARLRPIENPVAKPNLQSFGNNPRDFSYNADCQFGICKNNSNTPKPFDTRGY